MADEDPDLPNPLIERAGDALGGNPASRDVPGDEGDVEAPDARDAPRPSSAPASSGPASSMRRVAAEAGAKLQRVIDAAEDAADEIRQEAEKEAQAYLEQSRRDADEAVAERTAFLTELGQSLATRFDRMNELSDMLIQELNAALEEAGRVPSRPAAAPQAAEPPAAPGPRPVAYAGTRLSEPKTPEAPSSPSGDSSADPNEQALLRATQLAVSGTPRQQIEATLTEEYGVADASAIVDEILGESR